jgi:SagB-type dehydrogenase family enzyme
VEEPVRAELAHAANTATAYRVRSPEVSSTALRTHQFRFDNLSSGQVPRPAEDFLVASRFSRWDREVTLSARDYVADPSVVMLSRLDEEPWPEGVTVALPSPGRLRMELGEAIARRRSVRLFSGDPVSLAQLATLARHAAATTAEADVDLAGGGRATLRFRTVASGGGLYPVEVHVAALGVTGLDRALYRYAPREDLLVRYGGAGAVGRVLEAFPVPDELISLNAAAAVLLFVGRPWRSMRKYGPRGLRFVLHEVGAMSHAVHLTVAALGLGSVDCSNYYDDEANDALGCDGVFGSLLHAVVVGWPG